MRFREMDQDAIRGLLEAKDERGNPVHQDVLGPLALKEEAIFRNSVCPKCGNAQHEAFVDSQRPFTAGNPLPHKNLRCIACQTEFDPYTNLIRRVKAE